MVRLLKGILIWICVKANGSNAILNQPATVTGEQRVWAWLSTMTSITGGFSTLTVNIPDFCKFNSSRFLESCLYKGGCWLYHSPVQQVKKITMVPTSYYSNPQNCNSALWHRRYWCGSSCLPWWNYLVSIRLDRQMGGQRRSISWFCVCLSLDLSSDLLQHICKLGQFCKWCYDTFP